MTDKRPPTNRLQHPPSEAAERASTYLQILRSFGHDMPSDSRILDFGCGGGELVRALLNAGFPARGCDLAFPTDGSADAVLAAGVLTPIRDPYGLPYADASFDAVISDQVFEHVLDYGVAIDEIHRVLKPGGVTLHIFPSRLSVTEVHTHVPAAGFFRPYWWLHLWAQVGIRMGFQTEMAAAEAAHSTESWLRENTNYRSRRKICRAFRERFDDVRFCEREFLRQSRRVPCLSRLIAVAPGGPAVYSTFRSRVVFGRKR